MAVTNGINNKSNAFTSDTFLTATSGAITATSGNVVITAGNLAMPKTTGSTVGNIKFGTIVYVQQYGASTSTNIFLGNASGNYTLTTGSSSNNVGCGAGTGVALTSGAGNVFCGSFAGNAVSSGSGNTHVSGGAPQLSSTGSYNSSGGNSCLGALTTGGNNLALGARNNSGSGSAWTTHSSGIAVQNAGTTTANRMYWGQAGSGAAQQNKCFIAGIAGVTVANSAAVLIDTTGLGVGTVVSSQIHKENIKDLDSDFIMRLRPVSFSYKQDEKKEKQYGLIAEEVNDIAPELVIYLSQPKDETLNVNGDEDAKVPGQSLPDIIGSVQYHLLPQLILKQLQKNYNRLNTLMSRVNVLKGSI